MNEKVGMSLDECIRVNMGLVYTEYNKRYSSFQRKKPLIDEEDAVQAGIMGLWKAYERYDGSTKFSTYATANIVGYMLRLLNTTNTGCKFSVGAKELYLNLRRQDMLEMSPKFIARKLGVAETKVKNALDYGREESPLSLDVEDDDEHGFKNIPLPSEQDMERDMIMEDFLKTLKPKEAQIVRYMLAGYSGAEVARIVGCTRSNASRVFLVALEKARIYGMSHAHAEMKEAT